MKLWWSVWLAANLKHFSKVAILFVFGTSMQVAFGSKNDLLVVLIS
jgi:hypothetical protein